MEDEDNTNIVRAVASPTGLDPTVPECRKSRSGDNNQDQPRVQISREVHSEETNLRSSREVRSANQGLGQ